MRVLTIIVTFNSSAVVGKLLTSLATVAADDVYPDLVVVDNSSSDGTVETVRRLAPAATILELGANRGFAAGINAGLRMLRDHDAVLVLNADTELLPGSLAALLDALAVEGTGIAVPRLVGLDGSTHCSLRRRPSAVRALGEALLGGVRAGKFPPLGEVVTSAAHYERPRTTAWATGAAMLLSRACIDTVGAWDEDFFLYSEETDYALRAWDNGFAVRFTPRARVLHRGGELRRDEALWALSVVNRVKLHRKRRGRAAAACMWAALLIGEILRSPGKASHRAAVRALVTGRSHLPVDYPGWLCFSAQDWWYHNRAHSDFQLMTRVAEHRRVLFVNSIAMRMPLPGRSSNFLRRIVRKARSMARPLQQPRPDLPNFHVMTPLTLPLYGSPRIRALNARLVAVQVGRAAKRLGIHRPDVMITIPTAYDAVRHLDVRSVIYNRSDKHSAFKETDELVISSLERDLLRKADRIVYVSHRLMEDDAAVTGDRAFFLDHGVDFEHFGRSGLAEPPDLAAIPRPRLGFFGGLDDYIIDFELLDALARSLPEAALVLIGDATCSMTALCSHSNVHWLGFRPYEAIPAYGRGFDVALMPWLDNEWIRHSNPIKLKEYLALGLPIVSTPFDEGERYAEFIRFAKGPSAFVDAVRRTLHDGGCSTVERRRAAVASDSWNEKALKLLALATDVAED